MYDNHIGRGVFNRYQSMLNSWLEGNCKKSLEEITEKINLSYCEGDLSATQYDYLMNLIEEYK